MRVEDIKIGRRVICVFKGHAIDCYGKIGIITNIYDNGAYSVTDDNGNLIGGSCWTYSSSFDLYEEEEPAPSTKPSGSLTMEKEAPNSLPEKKPCPRAYYGLEECICETCPLPRKRSW